MRERRFSSSIVSVSVATGLLLVGVLYVVSLSSLRVLAQSESNQAATPVVESTESENAPAQPTAELSSEDPTSSEPIVFDNPSQNARIASLQQLYAQQVEAYRTSERQYELAKSQHEHLQSLTSLEEAVKATKAAMQRRSDVLSTYLDLLYASLQDTLGLELSYKESQSKQLEETVTLLRDHRQALETADSRDVLQQMTKDFAVIFTLVQEDAERTRSMIVLGRMQAVYDKAQLVNLDIKKLQETYEVSALKKAERDRAYTEIDRQFQTTAASLRAVREEIGTERNSASYSSVSSKLTTISSSISRIISYLDEVLRM